MSVAFCALLAVLPFAAPNVVLLSVDTLRADYLGCYGHEFNSSPNIDAFAKEGLLFEDCVCEVPLTNPSFGAMLSSLYPRMTGMTKNGLRMPKSVPLMPEIFKAAGYQTWCVQSNWTLKGRLCGLNRGFDIYRDDFNRKRWGFIKGERDGENVTDVALEILRQRDPNKPFFFWVHYSDPHAPYEFHKQFNPRGRRPLPIITRDRVRAKYDSEVAYTDFHVGRLLKELPRDNTIILFVADHGESLYEHNYLGHGRRIYQTMLRVPFIIRAPGVQPGHVKTPVCILDIAPTLLSMAGLSPAEGMLGRNVLVSGGSVPHTRFVETYGGAVPKLPGIRSILRDAGPQRHGVIHEGWKLIRGSGPELYYLPEDPNETKNLAEEHPERVKELTDLIEKWHSQCPQGQAAAAHLGEDDVQALKSLGYLE
jgi:arylsulfatase A-like enzyme